MTDIITANQKNHLFVFTFSKTSYPPSLYYRSTVTTGSLTKILVGWILNTAPYIFISKCRSTRYSSAPSGPAKTRRMSYVDLTPHMVIPHTECFSSVDVSPKISTRDWTRDHYCGCYASAVFSVIYFPRKQASPHSSLMSRT